jgi:autotransporter translocation and assembly factor TamB
VRGTIAGDVTVRGTFDTPQLGGIISLDLGSLRAVPLGVEFEDVIGR